MSELLKKRSQAQIQRQDIIHREKDGKYSKVFPCDVCGKSAGIDYHSHHDTDGEINDELICLCKKCYNKLDKFSGKEAVKIAFGKNEVEDAR